SAIDRVRVDQLLKKEDELPAFASILLGLASGFIVTQAVQVLLKLKAGGLALALSDTAEQGPSRAAALLDAVTEQRIKTFSSEAFKPLSKKFESSTKKTRNIDGELQEQGELAYLDVL